ncbi:MAG TPA: PrsW family glutamic-type intramembrane protease [Jatrophihabitantaceae bacterium]
MSAPSFAPVPVGVASGPVRPDRRARTVLVIAGLLSLAYGIQVLIDISRPKLGGQHQPLIGLLDERVPTAIRATFWCYLASLAVVLIVGLIGLALVRGAVDSRQRAWRTRVVQLVMAAVLVVPFSPYPISLLWDHADYAIVCVPSTVFALWLVHRMQRYRHLPVRMLIAAFVWGGLIGTGFGGNLTVWISDYYGNYVKDSSFHQLTSWLLLSAGVFEELGKGAGVAILYILYRRYFDNVVSGIVVGAAVGLGFNLFESVEYLSAADGLASAQQYWARQSLGLMGAHVAFTAAIGAGFGVARQARRAQDGRLVIACGFVLAMAAHFANDVFIRSYGEYKENWFSPSSLVDVVVLEPLLFIVLQGPFVLLYLLLWRAGLKAQRAGLAAELPAEARSGAVAPDEVEVLLHPERRFYLRMQALFRHGLLGYVALGRLFDAQLDLGAQRWHRSRDEVDEWAPDESALRERVRQRRADWDRLAQRQAVPA